MLNTGSWVHEPILVHGATPPHPYWPGGAVWLESGAPPRAAGLLDGLDAVALREPSATVSAMPRFWFWTQAAIVVFVLAGIIIALARLL